MKVICIVYILVLWFSYWLWNDTIGVTKKISTYLSCEGLLQNSCIRLHVLWPNEVTFSEEQLDPAVRNDELADCVAPQTEACFALCVTCMWWLRDETMSPYRVQRFESGDQFLFLIQLIWTGNRKTNQLKTHLFSSLAMNFQAWNSFATCFAARPFCSSMSFYLFKMLIFSCFIFHLCYFIVCFHPYFSF